MASAPQKKIGTRNYAFGTIPATEAFDIQITLVPAVGALLSAFAMSDASSDDDKAKAVGQALGALRSLDKKELKGAMQTALKYVSCWEDGGAPIVIANIDAVFSGSPLDLWKVFVEQLRVNFADFLAVARSGSLPAGDSK